MIYANKIDRNFCIRYRFWKKLVSNISLYLSTAAVLLDSFFLKIML